MFDNLTTLILEHPDELGDVVELPKLQDLMLRSRGLDVQKWHCPSLQRLALVYTYEIDSPFALDAQSIKVSSRLLSLIVYNCQPTVDETFWEMHPSLVHLGSSKLDYRHPPPRTHPLSHVSVIYPSLSKGTSAGFRSLINSGHPLKSVRYCPLQKCPVDNEWKELYWHVQYLEILGPLIPTEVVSAVGDLHPFV
ncbi:hypothetical protein PIIN_11522 [Serendipita indica DSM 11827]|uniref:Uncharacterized protein n=1 Tax=Serendipita indica (strain DSM 11827) TaxID=1109443 RepID=G4U1V2_SERID|nr:hypothetical protein PIIN_11522 [Serendipita indica DSM 11827]